MNIQQFFTTIFKGEFKTVVDTLLPKKKLEDETVIEEAEGVIELDALYLDRFRSFSLQNQNLLQGREESIKNLEKAYQSWQNTHNPLLLISEPGMGSSSLLHSTCGIYPNALILEDTINFESRKQLITLLKETLKIDAEVTTLRELSDAITENTVVIFENIERLFLRKVNGFSLLDDFILFVHATKAKIYWILTINRYSYYYLDRVRDFSSNFNSIVFLKPVDKDLINSIIQERNEGYNLKFLAPRGYASANPNFKEKTAAEKQSILEKEFYKKMASFADGNISRALLFWRNSVRRTQEKNIYLRAFEPKELSNLKLSEVLILEAILQHNSLSVSEIRKVFRNTSKGSQLALEKLMEKDAVIYKEYHNSSEKEYQINPLYMQEVKNLMKTRLNRNIV